MDDEEVLGHLLKIESEAAALVNDAQAEADRRVAGGEKQNRAGYEERYRVEAERLEAEFKKSKELIKEQYHKELDAYREKLTSLETDMTAFSAMLDRFVAEDTR